MDFPRFGGIKGRLRVENDAAIPLLIMLHASLTKHTNDPNDVTFCLAICQALIFILKISNHKQQL